jgi:metallo-beta-lactamase family protein
VIRLTFHGGAGTVTGSRHLLQVNDTQVLVDCGMFQGLKDLRERNWAPPGFDPRTLAGVLLTHAHIDHSGYLPRLVHDGFRGDIFCTPPTLDLAGILLHDSAHLQEEDALFYNEKGLSKHDPALPLYTQQDVDRTLRLVHTRAYGGWLDLSPELRVRFRDAGHLLGSAMLDVVARDADREVHLLFSGDVGRYGMPLVADPDSPGEPDYLVVESTYGDRLHPPGDALSALRPVLERMLERRATLLVPAFAVGRAQQIVYLARQLVQDGHLPRFPIYVDSPMAVDATHIYSRYPELHGVPPDQLAGERQLLGGADVHLCRTVAESKQLNSLHGPALLLSSSGMLTGGRVLHHLARLAPDPRQMIALVGYQAAGTRGRALQEGARSVWIHKQEIPVRAEVVDLGHLSGHADRAELQRWLGPVRKAPRRVFVVHGEPASAAALATLLHDTQGWDAQTPSLGQSMEL